MPKPKGAKPVSSSRSSLNNPSLQPAASIKSDENNQRDAFNSLASVDSEESQRLELELCWCIQQLQDILTNQQLNSKRATDATRSLKVLTSKTAPIVKKRQIMRAALGDYRAKMKEEEKKFANKANVPIKFDMTSPNKKSQFFKQSSSTPVILKNNKLEPSDNSFRFNFPTPDDSEKSTQEITNTTGINSINSCSKIMQQENSSSESSKKDKQFKFV